MKENPASILAVNRRTEVLEIGGELPSLDLIEKGLTLLEPCRTDGDRIHQCNDTQSVVYSLFVHTTFFVFTVSVDSSEVRKLLASGANG